MLGATWELGHTHHQLRGDKVWTTLQGKEQRAFPSPSRQLQQSVCVDYFRGDTIQTHLSSLPHATVSPWA